MADPAEKISPAPIAVERSNSDTEKTLPVLEHGIDTACAPALQGEAQQYDPKWERSTIRRIDARLLIIRMSLAGALVLTVCWCLVHGEVVLVYTILMSSRPVLRDQSDRPYQYRRRPRGRYGSVAQAVCRGPVLDHHALVLCPLYPLCAFFLRSSHHIAMRQDLMRRTGAAAIELTRRNSRPTSSSAKSARGFCSPRWSLALGWS